MGGIMSLDMTKMPKLGFGLMRLPEKDGSIDITFVFDGKGLEGKTTVVFEEVS